MKEIEERLKEMETRLMNKEAELRSNIDTVQQTNNMMSNEEVLDLRSPAARSKALERARKALPKRRSHNVNTTLDIVSNASPIKRAAFKKAGAVQSSKLEAGVMEAIKTGLKAPRQSAARKSLATTLSSIKRFRLQRAFCKRVGVSRKLIQKAKKLKCGRKTVPKGTVDTVRVFYETNSNQLPDKKLVSKKTLKPTHVMDVTISKLHTKYMKMHPDKPVSNKAPQSLLFRISVANFILHNCMRQSPREFSLCPYNLDDHVWLKIAHRIIAWVK